MTKSRKLYKKHKHREYYLNLYDIRRKLNVVKRRNGIPQSMGILFHVLVDGSVKVEPIAKDRYTFFRVKDDKMDKLLKSIRTIPVRDPEAKS